MKLFRLDGPFTNAMNKIFDCIVLSLLWFFSSLPIITVAASTNALYETMHKYIKREEGGLLKTFWEAFRNRFLESLGQSAIITALLLPFLLLVIWGSMNDMAAPWYGPALLGLGIIALASVQTAIYTFTLMRSTNKSFLDQLSIGFVLAIKHLPVSLLMAVILAGICIILDLIPYLAIILPALVMWLFDRFLTRIADKYPNTFEADTMLPGNTDYEDS